MNDILFGEWNRCQDGQSHYFLGGVTLCSSNAKVILDRPRETGQRNTVFIKDRCRFCRNRNFLRWKRAS
jgi:hypothetical protein